MQLSKDFKIEELETINLNFEDKSKLKNELKLKKDKVNLNKDDFENYIKSQNHNWRTFVYEENNKVLASCTILIERKIIHGMGKVGHIEDVVCDKNIRGKGLGRKMIDFATEYCLNQGCYKVILDCHEKNIKF